MLRKSVSNSKSEVAAGESLIQLVGASGFIDSRYRDLLKETNEIKKGRI